MLKKRRINVVDQPNLSLTSPSDIIPDNPSTAEGKKTKETRDRKNRRMKMTEEELDQALDKLIRNYPPVEKKWADPPIPGQVYCSFSFTPSMGSTPDSDGLYGLLKIRGTFANDVDRDAHAENIINNVDSYHAVTHGYVGQPIPLTSDDNDAYALEVDNIALKKKMREEMSHEMKERRAKEKKDMDEAKARAKAIETKQEGKATQLEDSLEKYTALRVKRSNVIFGTYELLKKLKQFKDTIIQTQHIIEKMDVEYPEFKDQFMDRYNKAAASAGIESKTNPIVRFLVGPVPFDLDIIPDKLPVIEMPDTGITYFDAESVVPRATANEILQSGGKDGLGKKPKISVELEVKKVVKDSRPTLTEKEIEQAKAEIAESQQRKQEEQGKEQGDEKSTPPPSQ